MDKQLQYLKIILQLENLNEQAQFISQNVINQSLNIYLLLFF